MKHFPHAAAATLLLCLAGCAQSPPALVSVYGYIYLDKEPLDHGDIALVPIEGASGAPLDAEVTDGYYTFADGMRPIVNGKYRVEISRHATELHLDEAALKDPDLLAQKMRAHQVPAKYNSQSELAVTITAASANEPLNFHLAREKKPDGKDGKGSTKK